MLVPDNGFHLRIISKEGAIYSVINAKKIDYVTLFLLFTEKETYVRHVIYAIQIDVIVEKNYHLLVWVNLVCFACIVNEFHLY